MIEDDSKVNDSSIIEIIRENDQLEPQQQSEEKKHPSFLKRLRKTLHLKE